MFGFQKNERDSIDDRELTALQKLASALLALNEAALEREIEAGILTEICHETKPHTH